MKRHFDQEVRYYDFIVGVPKTEKSKLALFALKIPAQDVKQAICMFFLQRSAILTGKDVTVNAFTVPSYGQIQLLLHEVHEYKKTVDSNTQPRFRREKVYPRDVFLKYFY
jgi:hypothetical protein